MDLHGGNIYSLQRGGKRGILDYSSNINPLGVPESLKKAIQENFSILEKYPDINYVELREKIGKYNNISKDDVIVGNGATEVLFLYMKVLKPKNVLIVAPTFAEYERALKTVESKIDFFDLREKDNFVIDISELKEKSKNYDLVVICNPNNPTGKFISLDKIDDLNRYLEKNGTKLFLDESFIEFKKGWEKETALNLKSENIFILRALTKFFALPGIRLGYGLTYDKNIVSQINEIREPWSVNAFADLAGKVILDDNLYIEKTEKWIEEERKFFIEELKKIDRIKVYGTETNFVLIKLQTMTAEIFRNKMIEKNILVRNASNFKFLNEYFVRLAIKDREKNIRVLESIKEVVL